jgi:pre-mRNA cleavage complex 2 protein Pcf11
LPQIYHATCHAEAVSSTNNLAARLRSEIEGRSRSGTPEVPSLRLTPPKAGSLHSPSSKKRKAESLSEESAHVQPPLKKLELVSA